jgi:hypothetical protein
MKKKPTKKEKMSKEMADKGKKTAMMKKKGCK